MDNLTHSLFGLTLARTALGRRGRGSTVALLLASNAPDIDIVAAAGGAARYLTWHRGPTHGPLGIVGLGFLAAAIAWTTSRWRDGRDKKAVAPRASLLSLWIISMVGVLCHVLMDLLTSYGTRPLIPFAWTWFAEDWLPIVDVYLLAILGAGLLFGGASNAAGAESRRLRNATIALALALGNYGVRATAHHAAIAAAPRAFGAQFPAPCDQAVPPGAPIDWWPRPRLNRTPVSAASRCVIEIAAIPEFLSPFRWRLVAHLSNGYEVRTLDLLADRTREPASQVRLVSMHYPNVWTPTIQQAANAGVAQVFLGFSRFPAARAVVDADGVATVRWTDLRFDADIARGVRERAPNLFGATVQLDASGRILRERLGS